LPNANMPNFLFRVPFNSKVRKMKRKLKNKSATADSVLMKRKDAITHSVITSKKNPETKRLLSNFIRFLLSFLLLSVAMQRE
jgi:hypothetical protein